MRIDTLALWHRAVSERDATHLDALLADDAVFHSPVVHTPQVGKAKAALYLQAAVHVLGNDSFRYVREVVGANDAVLEFQSTINGIDINGVDLIRWNSDGRIDDFKVMLRPLKALAVVQQKMAEMLQRGG